MSTQRILSDRSYRTCCSCLSVRVNSKPNRCMNSKLPSILQTFAIVIGILSRICGILGLAGLVDDILVTDGKIYPCKIWKLCQQTGFSSHGIFLKLLDLLSMFFWRYFYWFSLGPPSGENLVFRMTEVNVPRYLLENSWTFRGDFWGGIQSQLRDCRKNFFLNWKYTGGWRKGGWATRPFLAICRRFFDYSAFVDMKIMAG